MRVYIKTNFVNDQLFQTGSGAARQDGTGDCMGCDGSTAGYLDGDCFCNSGEVLVETDAAGYYFIFCFLNYYCESLYICHLVRSLVLNLYCTYIVFICFFLVIEIIYQIRFVWNVLRILG